MSSVRVQPRGNAGDRAIQDRGTSPPPFVSAALAYFGASITILGPLTLSRDHGAMTDADGLDGAGRTGAYYRGRARPRP